MSKPVTLKDEDIEIVLDYPNVVLQIRSKGTHKKCEQLKKKILENQEIVQKVREVIDGCMEEDGFRYEPELAMVKLKEFLKGKP